MGLAPLLLHRDAVEAKVALPLRLSSPEVMSTLPFCLMRPSAGSQMKAASMSPRSQAAAIWLGCMFMISSSLGLMPHCSSAYIVWKCVVDTKGTPSFLPFRSAGLTMPEPLRTTSASASLMSSRIQKSCRSTPRLTAAASGLDPITPICTSPDAIAVETLAPDSNWRQLTL
jgi:hypothetical protein